MEEEDAHSFTINVKRPKVLKMSKISNHPIKTIKCIQNRNVPLFRTKKITIPLQETLSVNKLKRADVILPFKLYMKQQDHDVFKKRNAISIYDKHYIKSGDLLDRLHVEHPPNEVDTVTDIDKCFFSVIENRPINLHVPIFKTFHSMLNNYLRVRYDIGHKVDLVLNIEINKRREIAIHDLSLQRLADQAHSFDKFIAEDYHNSMRLLSEWEQLENQVDCKILELQNLAAEMFSTMSRIIGLDYKFSQQQKYGRFLYYLSPPTWRLNNREFAKSIEIETKGFDYGDSSDDDTFTIIFEKLRKICYGRPIKPVLYFNDPDQIIEVFNAMENQQLHYFSHVTHLTPFKSNLKNEIKILKELIIQDSTIVQKNIQKIENVLAIFEENSSLLEAKFYKILYGMFYDSVGTVDVLKLTLHLEFCFEKVIRDKPTNMDIVTMARALENFYMDYSYRLDAIQSDSVRRAMEKCQHNEKQKVVKAHHAAYELRLFNRLEKQLFRAYGISNDHIYAEEIIKNHSQKFITAPRHQISEGKKSNVSLTAAEVEYLTLFTEWTEQDDPSKYLQRLSSRGSKH